MKTEIFLQMGLDRKITKHADLPDGLITTAVKSPLFSNIGLAPIRAQKLRGPDAIEYRSEVTRLDLRATSQRAGLA